MYHSLSTDHIPWLFQAPYTSVCPKNACHSLSKDQILQLVHRLSTMACLKTTYHGLSKDHTPWLVHRLPSMACPKTTYQQGLSKDHIPIGFVQRPHTNGACPINAYHGLFKGYLLITGHLPWVLQRPDTKACPYVTHKD